MTQLLCNGTRLDLYDGTSLQYKHTNPLFSFDKLECERTTTFSLPATPTNDGVLELARIPAYAGNGMRIRFAARVVDGIIIQDGYLYINKYDGTDYECIFVCGDLVGLQAIKSLGKIKDIVSYSDVVQVGTGAQTPAQAASTIWANVDYQRPAGATLRPSILLEQLYDDICTAHGITADPFPSALQGLRWICGKAKSLASTGAKFDRAIDGAWVDPGQVYPYPRIATGTLAGIGTDFSGLFDSVDYPVQYRYHWQDYDQTLHTDLYAGNVQHLVARQTIKITFPDNFPTDIYVGTFENGGAYTGSLDFYGDRTFSKGWSGGQAVTWRTGDPLAGRSVTIQAGQSFLFLRESDLEDYTQYTEDTSSAISWIQGWRNIRSAFDVTEIKIQGDGDVQSGDYVRLQDNLPEMTFAEFCKMLAYLTGTALNYTKSGGLQFDAVDVSTWQTEYIKTLTKRGEVQRTFSDYAQQNLVVFKSDDHVRDRLQVSYTINNINLEQSKTLATIPASEGDSADGQVYVEGDSDCLGTNDTGALLMRVSLPKNTGIQQLCTASTQYQVQARMTMLMYHAIDARTRLVVDGSAYVWTERAWQDDVAQFTLARL